MGWRCEDCSLAQEIAWAPQESGSESGTVKKPVTETSSLACENGSQEAGKERKLGGNGWKRNCGAKEIMG